MRAREISAEEVTRHHLERIAEHEHLHAVITVTGDQALASAREIPLGPLAGVPLLVKDIFDTEGVRTTYGSGIFRDHVPVRSATSVRRLLDAGAIMLGKANLHEFAWGVTSRNRAYGAVVNSARPDRIPGRIVGRQRERARGRPLRARPRHRHRRLDPAARGRLRRGGLQAGLRQRAGRRPVAARAVVRPRRPDGPHARRLRAGLRRAARRAARRRWIRPSCSVRRVSDADTAGDDGRIARRGEPACRRPISCACTWPSAPRCTARPTRSTAMPTTTTCTPRLAAGFAVGAEERAALVAALHAWRAACAAQCQWDVLVSPAFPGELPAFDVPATMELTNHMTAYTRPINWLGWPSAVTTDGAMHTGLDEAAVLAHALSWEAERGNG